MKLNAAQRGWVVFAGLWVLIGSVPIRMTHDKWDELLDYVGAAYAWLGIPIVIYFACWLLFVRLKGKLVVQWAFGPFILFSGIAVAPLFGGIPVFLYLLFGFSMIWAIVVGLIAWITAGSDEPLF